ncbi:MAG TPA: acetyl-CoA carboxylase biotin carboxylase subunit, partial [Candidatus Hydrogenedentes bacterium]|nr:acetyl-CoA carboxylase biotin carboxylase subunit [Candidatus Hydrogenedentota bacterium]
MLTRILIANRGEIAVRIIRACREMGITSIAVYSEADRDCLHTHLANESLCIGPGPAAESYLNIPSIIAAAEVTDAQAIHPGYGFLSESAKFAGICRECNIRFIGPSATAITLSGDKSACRQAVRAAGTPILPGSDGTVEDPKRAFEIAKEVGYPVLVKAAAGGGGKGMRLVKNETDLRKALDVATNEAQAAFGNGGVYLEKYIEGARHVEFQVLADEYGDMVVLGERECTIQRRHQKLIEETPCSVLTPELREEMARAALHAARAVEYTNAGTVEFLLGPDGAFYFIELNARIQVEHPVTEEVTGIDLVREQIRIARGEPLGYDGVAPRGAAIEARIYAENPDRNFAPSPGRIGRCHLPGGPGVRVDTHIYAGYEVPRYYDALLAKVVARGRDRDEAIARLSGALSEFETEGVDTTARFCARLIRSER